MSAKSNSFHKLSILALTLAGVAAAAPFGKVVPVGGHVADLALDARRQVLYLANFGANRIDVMSLADHRLRTPIYVPPQPAALALSPDARFLVIGHYANWTEGATLKPAITILDLDGNVRQTLSLGSSPLAIAFGNGAKAFVVTAEDFRVLDPLTATFTVLAKGAALTSEKLPVAFPKFPPEIVQASTGVSGDGEIIYVVAEGATSHAIIAYRVRDEALSVVGITAAPPLGPRVISVNRTGSRFLAGWALLNPQFVDLAQFPYPTGTLNVGSHAFDWSRDVIYAQIPVGAAPTGSSTPATPGSTAAPAEGSVLHVLDPENLAVRERLQLRENLAGRSVFSPDMGTLYAISDSGVTILPLADLERAPRVVTAQEDLIFRGNACDRRVIVRYLDVVDPSGARTGFSISGGGRGIRISPAAGVTPATVQIEVDPTAYMNQKGTVAVPLEIRSSAAVNLAPPVRLLINTREPEQRGAVISVPGKLVDMLADPVRDRVYVIRQDRNQILVLNGSTFETIQTLSTGNTPTQMAMTLDNRYLLIGADNSQMAHVYDLETLEQSRPIIFPPGHYPRSIAVSNRSILASVRSSASPEPKIDRIDFDARIATELPSLGIFKNVVHVDTVLMASPSGGTVIAAMPDGNVLLYDASADAFIAARKDLAGLSGALMAVSDQTFLVDNNILNASLVPEATLEIGTGTSSGFVVVDGEGVRTTMQSSSGPGVIQRLNLSSLDAIRPTSMIEAPITPKTVRTPNVGQIGQTILPFMRTLAPLSNRAAIASLTTSGLAVLPWNFDAALARPAISSMVNTADATPRFAPGSLVTIYGAELSALTAVNSEMPVPTTLGETCLTVNGALMPMFMASPDRMTAQLPFSVSGPAQVVIRAPGGTSDPFRINISPGAPAVFRNGAAGETTGISTIIRSTNEALVTLSNPIHPEDEIVIYLTGLGQTSPGLEAGEPAPYPAALATVPPEVALGRTPLEIRFAGLSPGLVGVYQINAKVPYWVSTGLEVPLTVTQAGSSTSVSVRVVK